MQTIKQFSDCFINEEIYNNKKQEYCSEFNSRHDIKLLPFYFTFKLQMWLTKLICK
jgi:hypothetical protein